MKWILIAALATAHAGKFRSWCERQLVAPDPYQFERYDTENVEHLYLDEAQRAIKRRRQSSELRILGDELRKRGAAEWLTYTYESWEYKL